MHAEIRKAAVDSERRCDVTLDLTDVTSDGIFATWNSISIKNCKRRQRKKKEHFYKDECLNAPKLDTDREGAMQKSECLCAQPRFILHKRLSLLLECTSHILFGLSIYGAALS
jgi:hypothetical protein